MPVASVVIPTYNRAYCLTAAVDSVLGQTLDDVEVVLVDDGSTDDTAELVRKRYGADPRVVYHRQRNAGVSAARNAGILLAKGEFVGLLDSDDTFLPWKIELQVAAMRRHPEIGMVWSDMCAVAPDGRLLHARFLRRMYSNWKHYSNETLFPSSDALAELVPTLGAEVSDARLWTGDIFSPMIMGSLVHTSTVLLRRERLLKVGGFRLDLRHSGEDYDFHLRTCKEGPVGYLDVVTVRYRRGDEDQLTRPELDIHVAKNFLRTIEPMIASDREKISLPEHKLDEVRAEAHAWVGEILFEGGDLAAARPYLLRSLGYRLVQPRTLAFFALSMLGNDLGPRVRETVRQVKHLARPSKPPA
jgi:glycosyltransferase involved in cell wall biosynthesis